MLINRRKGPQASLKEEIALNFFSREAHATTCTDCVCILERLASLGLIAGYVHSNGSRGRNPRRVARESTQEAACSYCEEIQWSYAIFWSAASATQQGVLAWGDGYYNGDIKTTKTTQPMEFKGDQIGLKRSEQLRGLYESLSIGDCNQQTKRPTASLSPEDLTAMEWYYLVCMSFTFGPQQGLPGRALASNQHIWLSDAQYADSRTFSRSLLAKSASIQTVVCFPFMDGVLELGTNEQVWEDPNLIQQVTTSIWELAVPVCSEQSLSSSLPAEQEDEDNMHPIFDHELEDTMALENHNLVSEHHCPLEGILSPFAFSFPSYPSNKETEVIHGTSEVQSHLLMDDEISNCLHGSLNSSDCLLQSFVNPSRILSSPKGERIKNHFLDYLQEGNHAKLTSLDLDGDKVHYKRTLSAILSNSKGSASVSGFLNCSQVSSFTFWTRNLTVSKLPSGKPQKLLKKILVDASWIPGDRGMKPPKENGIKNKASKPEGDDASTNHVLSERRRREKLNEKFLVLRSLIPSISKVDKASILGDTIEYLKELEKRVEELESCKEIVEVEARERRKHPDVAERTSDNYGNKEDTNRRKTSANKRKRKASDIEEAEAERDHRVKDSAVDINVTVIEKEFMLEMNCPWRDRLLLDIVDAISNINLDAHSVQSSTLNGILTLALKAKCRSLVVVSPGMVKRALQRVIGKC